MVPPDLQQAVYATFNPGQCSGKASVSRAWIAAAARARAHVARAEGNEAGAAYLDEIAAKNAKSVGQ